MSLMMTGARCRICSAPATTHMTYGHRVTRWPGLANGWYCDAHKGLSVAQVQTLLDNRTQTSTIHLEVAKPSHLQDRAAK